MQISGTDLHALLHPRSVALVGASAESGSVGRVLLDNLLGAGFAGTIHAVNPHRFDAGAARWSASVEALPETPDLAIVATPAPSVPQVVEALARRGCTLAVVISAGVTRENGLRQAMLEAAGTSLRIIGPNTLGVIMPHAGLNAAFARSSARPGTLAFISQSGALVTAMLDWAQARDVGFSGIVSVGDMADVDLADLTTLFASDPDTCAILLYIEGISDGAGFLAAARAATRHKPVIAIKAGRSAGASSAVRSHTGAMIGSFEVYEAAFRRAGVVAVDSLEDLFDAAETLCSLPPLDRARLAIVTNGGGAGILAVDELLRSGGELAQLAPDTIRALDEQLPAKGGHGNPVDLIGDAHPERYGPALAAVLADDGVDAVLALHCPTAMADGAATAEVVGRTVAEKNSSPAKPVLGCWLGDSNAAAARPSLQAHGIPSFETPEDAVRGLRYLLEASRARQAREAGRESDGPPAGARATATDIVERCRADGRAWLNEIEAKTLIQAYGIPTVATRLAASDTDVRSAAAQLAAPYAVKIVSPDIVHKSDAGGVALGLADPGSAAAAAAKMRRHIASAYPAARITGFAVETMVSRAGAKELIAGISRDPVFGAVIMVGAGGTATELLGDKAIDLAPLDRQSALALIGRTRIARLLAGYRSEPPADMDAVVSALVALSRIATDLADVCELDINPLLADADGVLALDARVRIRT